MSNKSVTIIGGGAVGCAIAYELSKLSNLEIFVIERNSRIDGDNQSSRNSGVIHAGIYYQKSKGPLKAKFCVEGNSLLYDFCQENSVPHKKTGKLVVATNPIEEEYLDDLLKTAIDNGVPGIRKITGEEAKLMEPNVTSTSALYVPTTGIIEPTMYVRTLQKLAEARGVYFLTGNKVVDIKPNKRSTVVTRANNQLDSFDTDIIINSAGLYSDEIARMINQNSPYEIEPVRGEAAKFYKTTRNELSMNGMSVYPAPYGYYNETGEKAEVTFEECNRLIKDNKVIKSVGVHLTPLFDIVNDEYLIGKTVTIGPTYTVNVGKEDYGGNLHPENHYLKQVARFFPNIQLKDIGLYQAGIRAKLRVGYDFVIEKDSLHPNCINLIGIDSPGLTSSLAIAKYVKDMI